MTNDISKEFLLAMKAKIQRKSLDIVRQTSVIQFTGDYPALYLDQEDCRRFAKVVHDALKVIPFGHLREDLLELKRLMRLPDDDATMPAVIEGNCHPDV